MCVCVSTRKCLYVVVFRHGHVEREGWKLCVSVFDGDVRPSSPHDKLIKMFWQGTGLLSGSLTTVSLKYVLMSWKPKYHILVLSFCCLIALLECVCVSFCWCLVRMDPQCMKGIVLTLEPNTHTFTHTHTPTQTHTHTHWPLKIAAMWLVQLFHCLYVLYVWMDVCTHYM